MGWKTDWLYQRVFQHIKELWNETHPATTFSVTALGATPDFFYIQQCGSVDWDNALCQPPIVREWMYSGADVVEYLSTEGVKPDPPEKRGALYSYGLIQFYIRSDRKRIVIVYVLGPLHGRGYTLKVYGQGRTGRLIFDPEANEWVS